MLTESGADLTRASRGCCSNVGVTAWAEKVDMAALPLKETGVQIPSHC